MRPPRLIILAGDWLRSFMTGPNPRRPPKFSSSPSLRPIAGMTLTAVVFELTIPMAASSAMIAEMTSAEVSPGMTIMSSPTEHTAVMASSFSMEREPARAAAIIPSSSLTGMNAPERPPTLEDAITPPFLTASLSIASAAVVPCAPHCSRPLADSCDLECCLLYSLRYFVKRSIIRHCSQYGSYYSRAGDAYAKYVVCFADSVEGAGHERVVLYGIAEYYELGCADALPVCGELRCFTDFLTHQLYSIHVDAGLG